MTFSQSRASGSGAGAILSGQKVVGWDYYPHYNIKQQSPSASDYGGYENEAEKYGVDIEISAQTRTYAGNGFVLGVASQSFVGRCFHICVFLQNAKVRNN